MDIKEFQSRAHELVDWIADYYGDIRHFPVKSQVKPGEIIAQLPQEAPSKPDAFDAIFDDFNKIIMPGMTHWQHPSFFAYFPANTSFPSILAEMLSLAIAPQCMSWQTSPAATELEERVMQWLRDMLGLPSHFSGVIEDTASTATLVALLTAREVKTNYAVNKNGLHESQRFTIYCSEEAHSSVERAVKIAGFGSENLRKIKVDSRFAMRADELEAQIKKDISTGLTPLAVVAALGTTGSTAIDPLESIARMAKQFGLWLHVDAAYAGTAMILPEMRHHLDGIEHADSFVFNPHKWMFTNFDCSAYFVKDKKALVDTFSILPEYLKTAEGETVNNYRDFGIQLGRRFRALKLWFVIRSFGVDGLQEKIRFHIALARKFEAMVKDAPDFEVMAQVPFATVCFRYNPKTRALDLNNLNEQLLARLNHTGKLYVTHTKLRGEYVLRLSIGQTYVTEEDVMKAWALIEQVSLAL